MKIIIFSVFISLIVKAEKIDKNKILNILNEAKHIKISKKAISKSDKIVYTINKKKKKINKELPFGNLPKIPISSSILEANEAKKNRNFFTKVNNKKSYNINAGEYALEVNFNIK